MVRNSWRSRKCFKHLSTGLSAVLERVECAGFKSEDLQKLAIRTPHRYLRDGSGKWRCPPGEAHGSPLGLDYRVWSSAEINWNLQRNLTFLEDYLRCDPAGSAGFVDPAIMA